MLKDNSMAISYTKKTWSDTASSGTTITASDLNRIETGLNSVVTTLNSLSKFTMLYNSGGFTICTMFNFVCIYVQAVATKSGSWDYKNCPYTLPQKYRLSSDRTFPCITENGGSCTGSFIVTKTGIIQVINFGSSGSDDSRYGHCVYPIGI